MNQKNMYVFARYMQLVSTVPTDPAVLSRLGEIYDGEQDKSQAFQYHYEVLLIFTDFKPVRPLNSIYYLPAYHWSVLVG